MSIYNRAKTSHFLTLASLPTEVIKIVSLLEAACLLCNPNRKWIIAVYGALSHFGP